MECSGTPCKYVGSMNPCEKTMSVVGFDFGAQNSRIAVVRAGGVDVICNEVSERATPYATSWFPDTD
jgi:molecular chaperone DnaK (HSP70)